MSGPKELRALVEALKPFAALADLIAKERPGWDHDGFTFGGPLEDTKLTMGDFRRARTALTRAESSLASPAGMGGWMPIETAPKDGSMVLLWMVHPNAKYSDNPIEDGWETAVVAHWIDHNGGGWTWHGLCGQPTLWMPVAFPLPAAPRGESE